MLAWMLFGVTLFFLIAVSIYAYRLDEELNSEPNPEYLDSLGKYRQTVVNEVLTYLQVWMAWDEPPSLDTNTFADVSQIVLTKDNMRFELNFDWAKEKIQIVLNYFEYTNENQISKAKTFKFKNFLVPKNEMFKFIQNFKKDVENDDGKKILTDVVNSAREAAAQTTATDGEQFTDEDFEGLLYEASIMLGDEVAGGQTTVNTQRSLFMILSYIFKLHNEKYVQYIKETNEKENSEE